MTSAADGEQHDAAVARSSPTRGRSHWAWPWVLLILALPGAGRSLYVAVMDAAAFFGEQPSPTERATAGAAAMSGASLWLATALLTAVVFRRVVVPVLCGLAVAYFAALAYPAMRRPALLDTADRSGWLSAWAPPTSWLVALCGASTLVLRTYGRLRTALRESSRHADH
ncbi:hypothetical protein [Micromonospora purpureochromogenes]|uniref:Tryptophan-associated transmembrane protein (Trp_oprn_chp) n=1 Tax=Micromonospora purpureochromogenes TaxID=47872 RepID=A0ABX2RTK4_9ACTN|nr:hypothetical protein [Micromonospora purpureochromogenes]NYF58584.1 hypothetical protein [Micromonospora purpureochromogenes]